MLHGALLDAEILAEVYLAMTRGQETLSIDIHHTSADDAAGVSLDASQLVLPMIVVDEQDQTTHQDYLEQMAKKCKDGVVWQSFMSPN